MPHGTGIGPQGQIPPSGLGHSQTIWTPSPIPYPVVESSIPPMHSSAVGQTGSKAPIGGALLLLHPGGAAAIDGTSLAYLQTVQDANPGKQVVILAADVLSLIAGYTLTNFESTRTPYAGSTGATFPKVDGATGCHMQGFTVQSGGILQTYSNPYATPGPYWGGNAAIDLAYGDVDDFGMPFAGIHGDSTISPGYWDGSGGGTGLPFYNGYGINPGSGGSASCVSDTLVPLGGGYRGFRATASIYCPFAWNLVGSWQAQFALYFTWYKLVPWVGPGPVPGVTDPSLSIIAASTRGGCC